MFESILYVTDNQNKLNKKEYTEFVDFAKKQKATVDKFNEILDSEANGFNQVFTIVSYISTQDLSHNYGENHQLYQLSLKYKKSLNHFAKAFILAYTHILINIVKKYFELLIFISFHSSEEKIDEIKKRVEKIKNYSEWTANIHQQIHY